MHIYLLKKKSEVFAQFKKFKLLVQRESKCDIKKLRIDGGSEYFNWICRILWEIKN